MERRQADPLHYFYRPFFDARAGQVFILSAPKDHIRDGLAAILIARHFPLPQHEGISFEPSRPTVQPAENIILVGGASLFIEKNPKAPGEKRPLGVGYERLGQRLERIARSCCYVFEGSTPRVLKNSLAGVTYASEGCNELGKEVDYAVIRRVYRDASENTILLEGIHGLGTLGAAKVATTPAYLKEIWEAVRGIDGYDPSLPLEVLIRATFDPSLSQEVYALSSMEAKVLNIVYNRRWIYEVEQRSWVDQVPYDIALRAWAEEPPSAVRSEAPAAAAPWLEIEADLKCLDASTRDLCRRLLGGKGGDGSPTAAEDSRRGIVLHRLTSSSVLFRLTLHEIAPWGGWRDRVVPDHPSEIRLLRKKFLVHLILCHFLKRRFRCDERSLRRYFPDFCRKRRHDRRPLAEQFTSTVNGRMREGFLPLFGEPDKPKDYLRIAHDRRERSYRLLLQRLRLVVKLRL